MNLRISIEQRWLITIAIMLATVMQVVDSTIINVALPHMQGALGANSDQISWTLTSYLVASAIFMPLTGYFSDRLGRKKYLLISVGGFVAASTACGVATHLTELILFRILQGTFGSALVPLSQAILLDVFPLHERGKAMAIWGMGIMSGPILGPTLGGYLTDIASWRWTFFVNVPFGLVACLLAWKVVPDTEPKQRKMNWLAFSLMTFFIAGLQYVLDRGNQNDWFESTSITIMALLSVFGLIGFIWQGLRKKNNPLFDLKIFKDRNFVLSSILLAAFGVGIFGTLVIQPLMLINLFNYSVFTAGLLMAPRGIASMISMIFFAKMGQRIDLRILIAVGAILNIVSNYAASHYSIDVDWWWILWPQILQGIGLGLIFSPLSVVAFSTLAPSMQPEAAGIYSLLRTLGTSVGIAVAVAIFIRHTQSAWNHLVGFITPFNPAVSNYLSKLDLVANSLQGASILGVEVNKQATMLAFTYTYSFIMWVFFATLPMIVLLRTKSSPHGAKTGK